MQEKDVTESQPPACPPIVPLTHERQKWFEDMCGWIMVVAVLVASVTYTSGLNPPGGFWDSDDESKGPAGSSILEKENEARYIVFFYGNATAFMASLVIIGLLMNEKFYCDNSKVVVLYSSMVLTLISLLIAYAAGCTRKFSTSIYVLVLGGLVLLVVIYSSLVVNTVSLFVRTHVPVLPRVCGEGCFPQKEGQKAQNPNSNV